eukprot:TRINITY_DN7445_c0_g1_i1.p1 TRINITY_DN7445_c0_g1~~TRINITY_DN7445_c0_g1_i1.p1  ORF type:complete len:270 (+),score=44.35 TRINITY_DN7445_c0_g1_i1:309-1118(+)
MLADEDEQPGSFLADSGDPLWYSTALGTISGAACVLVGYPFDTVKVRLQRGAPLSKDLIGSLFRGVWSPLLAVTPAWAANFFSYGLFLKMQGRDDLSAVTAAGAAAGVLYAVVMCPFEYVKCNTQASREPLRKLLMDTVRTSGPSTLYRGIGATVCRDVGQGAVYYYCAERLNRSAAFRDRFGDATPFAAGICTGLAHCTVEYPFDTVKTRYQTMGYTSYRSLLSDMFAGGAVRGVAGLFRGYPVWAVRAPLAHGCSFCVIDRVSEYLK